MTEERAKKMLKAKLECLKRETSGTDIDCNYRNCDECNLCYEQGNMGEQKEALEIAIKALEQQPCDDCVSREALKERFRWLEKATKYDNKDAEQQHFSYSTMMMYEIKDEIDNVIDSLPSVQPQSLEQIKWERDTAIEQLKQLGYGLGEKIESQEQHKADKYKKVAMDIIAEYLESEQSVISEFGGDFKSSAMILKERVMKYLKRLDEGENTFNELVKDMWIADYYKTESEDEG